MANSSEIVSTLRRNFLTGKTLPLEYRIQQLKNLYRMYEEKEQEILDAVYTDLRKNNSECKLTEIFMLKNDINHTLNNLKKWTAKEYVKKDFANMLDTAYIQREPYGVALIIGSWNYPIQLVLLPAQGAIAAGNCVILKPSELATATSKLLETIIPQYLDQDCFRVVAGGIPETTELLKEKFDYIFYTGNTNVGKIIHAAANKYLTPVTLELGGKSPCYVDDTVNITHAANRIVWGKFLNAGQTCVAPNYILCTKEVELKLIEEIKKAVKNFFGENPQESPDYGRIINDVHFERVMKYLKNGNIILGGKYDAKDKYIAPTVITDLSLDHPAVTEEIFGPVLPFVNVTNAQEAINYIRAHEKPLALYIFSNNKSDIELILRNTSSGGVCINDVVMHLLVDTLPFGGVGASGMGAYHGHYSFETFSHRKSVLHKDLAILGEKLSAARYPPFSKGKLNYLSFMMGKSRCSTCSVFHRLFFFACTIMLSVYVYQFYGNA